jgi:hypothetical protein
MSRVIEPRIYALFQSDKRSISCCLLALANRLGMRYDHIIRGDKRT